MNPIYSALGGGKAANPMLTQFSRFMQEMKGKDPNAMIQEMVSSGRVSQQQLDQAQQQARQLEGFFRASGMFGK